MPVDPKTFGKLLGANDQHHRNITLIVWQNRILAQERDAAQAVLNNGRVSVEGFRKEQKVLSAENLGKRVVLSRRPTFPLQSPRHDHHALTVAGLIGWRGYRSPILLARVWRLSNRRRDRQVCLHQHPLAIRGWLPAEVFADGGSRSDRGHPASHHSRGSSVSRYSLAKS